LRIEAVSLGADPPHEINVIVEVPVGGEPIKYEMDKDAGTLVVDRFLYTSMRYPGNYGFMPHTLSGDGDPLDVLIANQRTIIPGAIVAVRPVGVLRMQDEAGVDEKVIAVPVSRLTRRYDQHAAARDHDQADPALLRALQGSRGAQVGQGPRLG
jgi:inorganic pyrophosphatase